MKKMTHKEKDDLIIFLDKKLIRQQMKIEYIMRERSYFLKLLNKGRKKKFVPTITTITDSNFPSTWHGCRSGE